MTTPDDNAPDLDTLLTTYALGECTTDERTHVEAMLHGPDGSAVSRTIEEIRALAALLKEGADDLPERSASLRRVVLAAAASAPTPRPPRSTNQWWMLGGILGLATAAMVAAMPLLMESTSSEVAMRSTPVAVTRVSLPKASAEQLTSSPKAMAQPTGPARAKEQADGQMPLGDVAGHAIVTLDAAPASPPTAAAPITSPGVWMGGFGGISEPELRRSNHDLRMATPSRERYGSITEDPTKRTPSDPLSTFSIDVDTASYANVRRFLNDGRKPPRDAVRIEELVNYFRYDDPQPKGNAPFSVTVEAAACPWRRGARLVRIGLKGRDVARDARPAGNLVFLVDVSGSMGDPNKLPLVKQALTMLVEELTENDRVAIVTYAGDAGLVLPSTSGDQKERIRAAIDSLSPGGSTHGSAGITLAYEQAAEHFISGGANRVILATDGDLNVGITDDGALVDLITAKAKGGTFLTLLGFGQGNLQDEKMEKLADNGNGMYAYIDGAREARKVLVEQLTGSTITIAKDVKIQVEFNPAVVASYRLLGYENRALANDDFRNDAKDAGEIGAGHGVTALYEIVLVGDPIRHGAEPLKYQPEPTRPTPPSLPIDEATSRELLTVKLRAKRPDGDTSELIEVPLADRGGSFEDASSDLRFAAAVAAFGMILRDSEHRGEATLPMIARIAGGALGSDPGGYRAEFLDLVRRAESAQ